MIRGIALLLALAAAQVGPERGTLIAVGGGAIGPEIARRFVEAAGGVNAPVVVIPTAGERDDYSAAFAQKGFPRSAGMTNITVLHTRDRKLADSPEFAAPIAKARAVWFAGGRQWRLVDAYLGTRTERELHALLQRGGVIGGSSAGATIQGSYLVRGAREGNTIMMARGYERGFGFLRGVAVDQHLIKRKRENDMVAVVQAHPELLGIGIDEGTAIVVRGDSFEVVGASKVAVYDQARPPYYFLSPGDVFDLASRRKR